MFPGLMAGLLLAQPPAPEAPTVGPSAQRQADSLVEQKASDATGPAATGPSRAELAAESDRIERQKNIGLGLAYAGAVAMVVAGGSWAGFGVTKAADSPAANPLLVTAAVSSAATVALLTCGGVLFFRSRERRKQWRKAALSGYASPQGGGVVATFRF